MSKSNQVLILEPAKELRFRGPFDDMVTVVLKLTNPSDRRVCFKLITTAPKLYCVRPNSGIIETNGCTMVSVMLQPFVHDPNVDYSHRFIVRAIFAPEGNIEEQERLMPQIWKEVTPNNFMDSKLKSIFEMPVSGGDTTTKTTALEPDVLEVKVKAVY